jgi:hypothetical protein
VVIALLEGAAFGLFFVGGVGFVAARAPAGLAGTAQGVFSATTGLATILGTAAAGVVATAVTIPGMFAVAAAVGLVAALAVADAVRGAILPGPAAAGLAPGPHPIPVPVAPSTADAATHAPPHLSP